MANCVVGWAYACLFLGFLACGTSFFAPYWVDLINENRHEGLWGRCGQFEITEAQSSFFDYDCIWFNEQDYGWQRSKPMWHVACQVMNSFGVVALLAILIVASLHVCCSCCNDSISLLKVIGVVILLGVALITTTLAMFAGKSYSEKKTSINSAVSRFEWGYFLAIPGVILSFISSILYLIESCRYYGYEGSGRNEIV